MKSEKQMASYQKPITFAQWWAWLFYRIFGFIVRIPTLWRRAMVWLAGADYKIYLECPGDSRMKILTKGATILVPMLYYLIAGVIWGSFHRSSLTVSLMIGIVAAVIIMIIDRYMLKSLKSNSKNYMIGLAIRIIISVPMSYVASLPIELIIFDGSISDRLALSLKTKTETLEKEEKSELQSEDKKVSDKYETWQKSTKAYNAEIDGTSGTGRYGDGPSATEKRKTMEVDRTEYEKVLREARLEKAKISAEFTDKIANSKTSHSTDFTERYVTMKTLQEEKPNLAFFGYMLMLLLMTLELAPVIITILVGKTAYDLIVSQKERLLWDYEYQIALLDRQRSRDDEDYDFETFLMKIKRESDLTNLKWKKIVEFEKIHTQRPLTKEMDDFFKSLISELKKKFS